MKYNPSEIYTKKTVNVNRNKFRSQFFSKQNFF